MRREDLTADRLRSLFDYDPRTGVFTRLIARCGTKAGEVAGSMGVKGYLLIGADGFQHKAHRLAWLYVYGAWPSGCIDHIDCDKTNNRIANLRDVPHRLNMQNMRRPQKRGSTGYLGVSSRRGRFQARIVVNGKLKHLGSFADPSDAHEAYLSAKRRYHQGCTL